MAADRDESYGELHEAPLKADPSNELVCGECEEQVVQDDEGEAFQIPKGVTEPRPPPLDVQKRHNLTHWPYANWCPHCVMARRNESPHLQSRRGENRSLPLFVLDYCFIRSQSDAELTTLLVGKLYPSRRTFGCVVDTKGGADAHVVGRLADFFRSSGLTKFDYKSDQESSVKAVMEDAIAKEKWIRETMELAVRRSGRAGEYIPLQAIPESSAVGSSPSNGRAERAVQQVEDQVRVGKIALEARLGVQLPCSHPVMRWLVEHSVDIINKYAINKSGLSPHEELHGKKAAERRVEFGERVFYSTPKKGRAKMDHRWKVGIYLGHCSNSNELYIGTKKGNVRKARTAVRIVEGSRWDRDAVLRVAGVPGELTPNPDGALSTDDIEGSELPHEFDPTDVDPKVRQAFRSKRGHKEDTIDDGHGPETFEESMLRQGINPDSPAFPVLQKEFDQEVEKLTRQQFGPRRVRITHLDLEKYGYTDGCPRCTNLAIENYGYTGGHNEACRRRIYVEWAQAKDPKLRKATVPQPSSPQARSSPLDDPPSPRNSPPAWAYERDEIDEALAAADAEPEPPSKKPRGSPSSPLSSPIGAPQRFGPPPHTPLPGARESNDDDQEPPAKRTRTPDFRDTVGEVFQDENEDDVAQIFGDFEDDPGPLVQTLVRCGVDRQVALDKVHTMMKHDDIPPVTFVELYGRGGIHYEANRSRRDLNVMGLGACDLRTTKPDGNPWDFSKKADRKMAMDKIDQETPDWVIGSPPCTPFCAWNQHMNYPKMDRERVESLMKEGRMHLEFMAKVYRKQYRRGRFFLHEHPATAASWSEQSIDHIAKLPGVFVTKADQCQYGLVSNSDDGKPFPALKPTKFMTNAEPMSKLLMKRCTKDQTHTPAIGQWSVRRCRLLPYQAGEDHYQRDACKSQ